MSRTSATGRCSTAYDLAGRVTDSVVAVTLIALPGAAPTFLQGVLAGAAGSAASQAVGLATGIQKKFDFKGLAMSALAGGVTAGLGDVDIVGNGLSKFMSADKFFNAAIRGLAANALTQGVGVATGLQKRFDWAGVAAAGVGAGVGQGVGGGRFASGLAGGLAGSAAQSLVTGKDFGDTLMGNLPGIIANTVGNLVADQVAGRGRPSTGNNPDDIVNQDAIRSVGRGLLSQNADLSLDNLLEQNIADSGARLQGQQLFALAGGDAGLARSLLASTYGPTMAEASKALIASGSVTFDATVSGGDLNGYNGPAVYGAIGDTWTNDLRSFGRYVTAPAGGDGVVPARWVENEAVMRRVGIAQAEFDTELLRAGFAPVDIGMGGYNILAGNGGLRDYLAVGSVVPFGKLAGVLRRAEGATPVIQGVAFENSGVAAARAAAFLPGQSVRRLSVRAFDDAGNLLPGRTVLDLAGNRVTGGLGALEFKLHEGVALTLRQAQHFPYLARNGGQIVGNNGRDLGLRAGRSIGPLDVQRINGPTLPLTWWPK